MTSTLTILLLLGLCQGGSSVGETAEVPESEKEAIVRIIEGFRTACTYLVSTASTSIAVDRFNQGDPQWGEISRIIISHLEGKVKGDIADLEAFKSIASSFATRPLTRITNSFDVQREMAEPFAHTGIPCVLQYPSFSLLYNADNGHIQAFRSGSYLIRDPTQLCHPIPKSLHHTWLNSKLTTWTRPSLSSVDSHSLGYSLKVAAPGNPQYSLYCRGQGVPLPLACALSYESGPAFYSQFTYGPTTAGNSQLWLKRVLQVTWSTHTITISLHHLSDVQFQLSAKDMLMSVHPEVTLFDHRGKETRYLGNLSSRWSEELKKAVVVDARDNVTASPALKERRGRMDRWTHERKLNDPRSPPWYMFLGAVIASIAVLLLFMQHRSWVLVNLKRLRIEYIIVVGVLVSAVLLSTRNSGNRTQEAKGGSPVHAYFKDLTHDFGPIVGSKEMSHEFIVANDTRESLRIGKVWTHCGCLSLETEQVEVRPGQPLLIRATIRPEGYEGRQDRLGFVTLDPGGFLIRIRALAHLVPEAHVNPHTIELTIGPEETTFKSQAEIRIPAERAADVVSINTLDNSQVELRLGQPSYLDNSFRYPLELTGHVPEGCDHAELTAEIGVTSPIGRFALGVSVWVKRRPAIVASPPLILLQRSAQSQGISLIKVRDGTSPADLEVSAPPGLKVTIGSTDGLLTVRANTTDLGQLPVFLAISDRKGHTVKIPVFFVDDVD